VELSLENFDPKRVQPEMDTLDQILVCQGGDPRQW